MLAQVSVNHQEEEGRVEEEHIESDIGGLGEALSLGIVTNPVNEHDADGSEDVVDSNENVGKGRGEEIDLEGKTSVFFADSSATRAVIISEVGVRVVNGLLGAEALKAAAGRLALVCLIGNETPIFNGVALKLVTVSSLKVFTVSRGIENESSVGGNCGDVEDKDERGEEEDSNDGVGLKLTPEVIHAGEVTVLPDDISRLRALVKLEGVAEQLLVILLDEISKDSRIVALEGDEGSSGNGQIIEILEKLIDLSLLFAHGIEVLSSNASTTLTKGIDKLRVVEGENDVGNLGTAILRRGVLLLGLAIEFIEGPAVLRVGNPVIDHLFASSFELLLEGKSGSLSALHTTSPWIRIVGSLFVDVVSPVKVDRLVLHGELNRVVTSGHGGAVPLDHLDLATLVHVADGNSEEESNEDTHANSKSHVVVLGLLLVFGDDTRVLDEQSGIFALDALFPLGPPLLLCSLPEALVRAPLQDSGFLTDG